MTLNFFPTETLEGSFEGKPQFSIVFHDFSPQANGQLDVCVSDWLAGVKSEAEIRSSPQLPVVPQSLPRLYLYIRHYLLHLIIYLEDCIIQCPLTSVLLQIYPIFIAIKTEFSLSTFWPLNSGTYCFLGERLGNSGILKCWCNGNLIQSI